MRKAASSPAPSFTGALREEETDDGWILLRAGGSSSDTATARPPRPPPPRRRGGNGRHPASQTTQPPPPLFDPSPDDLVARYLPARRALRCGDLPPQIHDAGVYGAHPAFLAGVYPPANNADRPEWLFFACRGRGLGGKRRAGPGAYRLAGEDEAKHPRGAGAGAWYCHSFRYHEDSVDASAARETEWRMDEYGDRGVDRASDFDMVVCKVYPARGGALHKRLILRFTGVTNDGVRPQVLVQLYLGSLGVGDPLRCRMHAAADVCAAHPAVLTAVLPAANDRFEWLFMSRRRRTTQTEARGGDGGVARPRRAGAGKYVPAARYWGVKDGQCRDLGYRRLFRYREDDDEVGRMSRTVWFMEEYGFGPDFPYGEHGGEEELLVYKVYQRMTRP